jgi:excisionase family DNA binding protein
VPGQCSYATRATSLEEILGLRLETPELQSIASANAAAADSVAPAPPFLSLQQASAFLSVSLSTLNRLLAKGELVALRIGARRKISADNLTAYLTRYIPPLIHITDHDRNMSNQRQHIQNIGQ